MIYLPLIIFVTLQTLGSQDVSAIMCYECHGNDCASDPANKIDCGEGNYCGFEITTEYQMNSSENPEAIVSRFCKQMIADDPKQNRCNIIGQAGEEYISEICQCGEDLCNASEPDCSIRDQGIFRIRWIREEALAEKCKNEIDKYNSGRGN